MKRNNKNGILTRRACRVSMGPKMRRRPPATRTCGGRPPPTTTKKKNAGGRQRVSASWPATAAASSPTGPRRRRPGTAVGRGYRWPRLPATGIGRARVGRVGGDDDGGDDDGGGGDGSSCGGSGDDCGDRAGGSDRGGCAAGRRCAGTGAGGVGNTTAIAAGRHTSSCPWPLRLVRAVIVVLSARRRGRPAGQPPIWHGRRQSTIYGNVVVAVVVAACSRGVWVGGWPTAAFSSPDGPGDRTRPGLSVGEIRTRNH